MHEVLCIVALPADGGSAFQVLSPASAQAKDAAGKGEHMAKDAADRGESMAHEAADRGAGAAKEAAGKVGCTALHLGHDQSLGILKQQQGGVFVPPSDGTRQAGVPFVSFL